MSLLKQKRNSLLLLNGKSVKNLNILLHFPPYLENIKKNSEVKENFLICKQIV